MIGKTLVWTLAAAALLVTVLVITLHREGLYALPGQTVVVRFAAGTSQEDALAKVADAGAALIGYGNSSRSLRLRVIDPAPPESWPRPRSSIVTRSKAFDTASGRP